MLVEYSDSESESEQQEKPTALPPPPSLPKSGGLSAFLPKPKGSRKNIKGGGEGSGPKKIVVNLPKLKDDNFEDGGPPTKKARIGGGGLGLSSMLPAPKRSGAVAKNAPLHPAPIATETKEETEEETKESSTESIGGTEEAKKKVASGGNGFISVASSTRFVPQSVARKPIQPASLFKKSGGTGGITRPAPAKPKVSLFGSGPSLTSTKPIAKTTLTGEYQPIMLTAVKPANRPKETPSAHEDDAYFEGGDKNGGTTTAFGAASNTNTQNISQDLETVAREAGLSDAAMRQLYGRRGRGNAPINITNYSVDEEYNNNEVSRSLGLLEEVKPVRAIAPGKHQLSSLLNAAQSQRGALEDAFAQGKRNKKEAGSKYGW